MSTTELELFDTSIPCSDDTRSFEPVPELIEIGDLVAIYSRGRERVARVTKVGPKRVTAEYTTRGAVDEAQRIAGGFSISRAQADIEGYEARADEYEALAAGRPDDEWIEQGAYSRITAAGLRKHVTSYRRSAARRRAEIEVARERPQELWRRFVHTTTKTVNRDELRGHRAAAERS